MTKKTKRKDIRLKHIAKTCNLWENYKRPKPENVSFYIEVYEVVYLKRSFKSQMTKTDTI